MKTECTKTYSSFQVLGRKEIVADFSGGTLTSDGGGILLREVEHRTGILHGGKTLPIGSGGNEPRM